MGSLRPGGEGIGPFAHEDLADFSATGDSLSRIGPCISSEEYFIASTQLTLDLIM